MMPLLARDSYLYGLCEGLIVFALSLHMVHDMFCESFARCAERYSHIENRPLVRQHPPKSADSITGPGPRQ